LGLAAALPKRHEIAPGVFMPVVNLGGTFGTRSNYTSFIEQGGRGLDCAWDYNHAVQTSLGAAISSALKSGAVKRSDLFITTKVRCCKDGGTPGTGGKDDDDTERKCTPHDDLMGEVETDLKELGVDYADLILLHEPCIDVQHTVAGYRQLTKLIPPPNSTECTGPCKTRAVGVSNWDIATLDALIAARGTQNGETPTPLPAVNQCRFSVKSHFNTSKGRDDAALLYFRKHGITYEAYAPLGGSDGVDVIGDSVVDEIAKKHKKTGAQVALRWIAQQGSMFVTAGSNAKYIAEDLDIFGFELTEAEMATLSARQ
jgi:diketogulonate reductase-like aldo/keto reductase